MAVIECVGQNQIAKLRNEIERIRAAVQEFDRNMSLGFASSEKPYANQN